MRRDVVCSRALHLVPERELCLACARIVRVAQHDKQLHELACLAQLRHRRRERVQVLAQEELLVWAACTHNGTHGSGVQVGGHHVTCGHA